MDHLSKPIFTIGKNINIPPCSLLHQVCRAWSFLRGMGFTCETADVLEGLTLVGLPAIHYLKLLGHEMSWICKHQYMRNWEVNRDVIGNFWAWNGGLVLWGTTLCMKQTARNYVTFRISKLHHIPQKTPGQNREIPAIISKVGHGHRFWGMLPELCKPWSWTTTSRCKR